MKWSDECFELFRSSSACFIVIRCKYDSIDVYKRQDWKTPVDTDTPGETIGTIVVTYPDGSKEEVEVTVNVVDTTPQATDTELYTAQGGVVNKPYGQTATNDEVIGVVTTDAPAEKIQSIVAVDAIPTTGQNQPVNVKVTYVDGTNDTVIVTVNYGLATDAYDLSLIHI